MTDARGHAHGGIAPYFILDNSGPDAGTLYFDSSGLAGNDAKAIAILTGVTSLQLSDFLIT